MKENNKVQLNESVFMIMIMTFLLGPIIAFCLNMIRKALDGSNDRATKTLEQIKAGKQPVKDIVLKTLGDSVSAYGEYIGGTENLVNKYKFSNQAKLQSMIIECKTSLKTMTNISREMTKLKKSVEVAKTTPTAEGKTFSSKYDNFKSSRGIITEVGDPGLLYFEITCGVIIIGIMASVGVSMIVATYKLIKSVVNRGVNKDKLKAEIDKAKIEAQSAMSMVDEFVDVYTKFSDKVDKMKDNLTKLEAEIASIPDENLRRKAEVQLKDVKGKFTEVEANKSKVKEMKTSLAKGPEAAQFADINARRDKEKAMKKK